MDIYRKFFAERLRDALLNQGKQNSDLAELMEVSDATVSRWVNGKDMPSPQRRSLILEKLGMPQDYFEPHIRQESKPLEPSPEIEALLKEQARATLDAINPHALLIAKHAPGDVLEMLAQLKPGQWDSIRIALEIELGAESKKSSIAKTKK